jgi:hypothetical protein
MTLKNNKVCSAQSSPKIEAIFPVVYKRESNSTLGKQEKLIFFVVTKREQKISK